MAGSDVSGSWFRVSPFADPNAIGGPGVLHGEFRTLKPQWKAWREERRINRRWGVLRLVALNCVKTAE
jgi:hypothetical protein